MHDDRIDITIKTTLLTEGNLDDVAAVVADLVHNALAGGYDIGPLGVSVRASRPSFTAHSLADKEEAV